MKRNAPGRSAAGRSAVNRNPARATAWPFLAPMLIVLTLVAAWPLARTVWFSFTDATLDNLGQYSFIGFENYLARYDGEWFGVLADPAWWRSVWNTVWFTAVAVSLETVLGTIIALALNGAFPGRGAMRAIILIPWAIPTVVSARMWNWMLHDQFGVINDVLLRLGIIAAPIAWTADPDTALWAVVMVDVWKTTPFVALLALAALQMLPNEIYDAAKIDGAGPIRTFFSITLPLIRPALLVAITFRMLDSLRVFDLVYVLTAASTDTMSVSVYARQELVEFQDVGLGSAAATLVFVLIALVTAIYITVAGLRVAAEERA